MDRVDAGDVSGEVAFERVSGKSKYQIPQSGRFPPSLLQEQGGQVWVGPQRQERKSLIQPESTEFSCVSVTWDMPFSPFSSTF